MLTRINQHGGLKCSLCGSPGVTKTTCPLNSKATSPIPSIHPLAQIAIATGANTTKKVKTSTPKESNVQLRKKLQELYHNFDGIRMDFSHVFGDLDRKYMSAMENRISEELYKKNVNSTNAKNVIKDATTMVNIIRDASPLLDTYSKALGLGTLWTKERHNPLSRRNRHYSRAGIIPIDVGGYNWYPDPSKIEDRIEELKIFEPKLDAYIDMINNVLKSDPNPENVHKMLLNTWESLSNAGQITMNNFNDIAHLIETKMNDPNRDKELQEIIDYPEDYFPGLEESKTRSLITKNQEKYLQLQYEHICHELSADNLWIKVRGMADALEIPHKYRTKSAVCADIGARLLLNQQLGLPILSSYVRIEDKDDKFRGKALKRRKKE